ncbi:efflux RND transporter permease subunit [bacterium]|nr:efflux RND transporter permease subunit [bacterium]
MKITHFSIKHSVAVYVLIALLVIMGLGSLKKIPRELFPDIQQPLIIISTIYPGVSPQDMETLVTDKIEKKLKELQYIDEITSSSGESFSSIVVKFEPTVDTEWALSKVKDKVDLAIPDLPDDVETPLVKELAFSEFPVVILNFSGDFPLNLLKKYAEDFKDEIEGLNGILRADLTGGIEREIQITVNPDKLAAYEVDLNSVINAIKQANINIPGGVMELGSLRYTVRVPGEISNASELEGVIVKNMMGTIVYLRDVATINDSFKEIETISRYNGKQSVSLQIVKRSGANLIEVVESVRKLVLSRIEQYPKGLQIKFLSDTSTNIKDMLKELTNNLITGILLVIIVLFLFLGFVNSLFVAIALPLSMLIGMVFFELMGISLNMIVLFALILALGMLVDNGIVVIENIYRYTTKGIPRQYAAYKGTKEVAWPIIASTATTVGAFVPLLFWTSIMGEFMKYLPIVLIITLSASLFIALVINPVLASSFMKSKIKVVENDEDEDKNWDISLSKGVRAYKIMLEWSLNHRFVVIFLAIATFIGSIIFFAKNNSGVIFFPESTPQNATIKIEAPVGTRMSVVDDRFVKPFEKELLKYDDIISVVADIGVDANGNIFFAGNSTPHNAKITIQFKKVGEFKKSPYVILEELREFAKQFTGVQITVEKQQNGPPVGKPIQLSISGDDFMVIKPHIDTIMQQIKKEEPGIVDLKNDFLSGMPEVQIKVDREKAKRLHLTIAQISSDIRTAIHGNEASKFRVDKDEYDITVRYVENKRASIEDIKNITIPVMVMDHYEIIPLKSIADFEIVRGYSVIKHTDHKKTITITGDVQGVTSDAAMKKIQTMLKNYSLPIGYKLNYGGENKEQAAAAEFLSRAFTISIFIIAMILILQFNSILIPLVILFSVVLSLIGVFFSIGITNGQFVVVMTGIGVISLAGVVVNNAIVLIDYIKQLEEAGIPKFEAIVRSGVTRLRPVLLTAVTTVFGLVPMMFGLDIDFTQMKFGMGGESSEMWKSMANAVGYGLIFATILTLIVVPVTYSLLDGFGNFMKKLFRRPTQNFDDSEMEQYEKIK